MHCHATIATAPHQKPMMTFTLALGLVVFFVFPYKDALLFLWHNACSKKGVAPQQNKTKTESLSCLCCFSLCHDWKCHCHAEVMAPVLVWSTAPCLCAPVTLVIFTKTLTAGRRRNGCWCEDSTQRKRKRTMRKGTPNKGHCQSPMEP